MIEYMFGEEQIRAIVVGVDDGGVQYAVDVEQAGGLGHDGVFLHSRRDPTKSRTLSSSYLTLLPRGISMTALISSGGFSPVARHG